VQGRNWEPQFPSERCDVVAKNAPNKNAAKSAAKAAAFKKAELELFRTRLVALRNRLRGDVSQLADSALKTSSGDLSSMPIHMADVGSDNFDQDFTISLMQNEEAALEAIVEALDRVQDGTFGICQECNKPIPKMRLEAIPYTPVCIGCATKLESEGGS
jgi:DnaK suppressor protein